MTTTKNIPIETLVWDENTKTLAMKIDLDFCSGNKKVVTVVGKTRNITYKLQALKAAPNDLSQTKAYWLYNPVSDRANPLSREVRSVRLIVWKEPVV